MAATQELIDYVKNRLEADEPQLKIKDELKANGWTDEDVNEAFMANGIGAPPPKKKSSPLAIGFLVFSLVGFAVAGYFAYENLARPQAKFVLEKSFEKLQSLKYYSTQVTANAQASLSGQKITGELSGTADNDFEFLDKPQNKTEIVLNSSFGNEIKAKTVFVDSTFYLNSDYLIGFLNSQYSHNLPEGAWIKIGKDDIEAIAALAAGNNPALQEQIKGYYETSIKDQVLAQDKILKAFAESKFISVGNYLGKKKIGNETVYAFEVLFDRIKFAKFVYDVASASEKRLTLEAVEKAVNMLSLKQIELWVMRDYTPRRLMINGDVVLDEPSYETPKVNFSFDAQWLNVNKKVEIVAPMEKVVGISEIIEKTKAVIKERTKTDDIEDDFRNMRVQIEAVRSESADNSYLPFIIKKCRANEATKALCESFKNNDVTWEVYGNKDSYCMKIKFQGKESEEWRCNDNTLGEKLFSTPIRENVYCNKDNFLCQKKE